MNQATRILLVDDDPGILKVFSKILRVEGYEVWEASTGQEALQVTRQRHPDLVLLDVNLPDLNGVEVCRQIKADPGLPDIFVVLFSGEATSSEHAVSGLESGADEYMSKLLDWAEFRARLRTLVHLRDATAALRASEQHYRRLIEILPDAVGLFDLQGRLMAANPQAAVMLGHDNPDDLLEKSIFDLTPPEEHERMRADIAATLQSGPVRNAQYTLLGKHGLRCPVELNAAALRDGKGQPFGLVAIARDITQRNRTESQLTMLAHALESSTEPICVTDLQDRFIFVNRAFQSTYGYTKAEILGQHPEILFSPRNPPSLMAEILAHTRVGGWRGEVLDRRKDGTEFPIFLSTSQVKDADGNSLGLIGVSRDISEEKRAEKQAAAFSQLGYRLSASNSPRRAAEIILGIAAELFDWDAGDIHLYQPTEDKLSPVLRLNAVGGQKLPVESPGVEPAASALMRLVMKQGARLVPPQDPPPATLNPPASEAARPGSGFSMYVPIRSSGGVLGVLSIHSHKTQAYSSSDLSLLQTLADHCGEALHRIEVADALHEIEAQYRSIFENATEGIFRTTPDGQLLSANPALSGMFGYSSPKELMSSITDIERQLYVTPEKRAELKRLLETRGVVQGFEVENRRKDGSRFWVSLNVHVVRDSTGAVKYFEGTNQDINERKLAQQRLADALELNRALLDNISDPAWLKNAQGRFLAGNGALAKFYDRPLDQVIGKTVFDLAPQQADRLTRDDEAVRVSGKPAVVEEFMLQADGQSHWFETIKSPIFDEFRAVTGIVGIARDVTERKWAENLLQIQRDFGTFLSTTDDLRAAADCLLKVALRSEGLDCGTVYLVEPSDGALVLAAHEGLSAAFIKRAWRFAADRMPSTSARRDPALPEQPSALMAGLVRELKREGLQAMEVLPLHHSGQVVAVLNLGSHLHPDIPPRTRRMIDAIATQAGGAVARIRAEQSLRANRELLEKTLHSLRSAVFIVDAGTGIIQECNPAATLIFGYRRQEMIGRTTAFLHVDQALFDRFRAQTEAAFKQKGFLENVEFMMRRKNGTAFPTNHTVMPIRNQAGRLLNWVSNIGDISQRKEAEAELRRLPQRIIQAQETERLRVARELHDGVNQIIASIKMRLRKAQDLSASVSPAAREILSRCDKLLVQAIEENRRIAHNLRPSVLDELGLAAACQILCRELQLRSNLAVKCSIADLGRRLPPAVELNLFRIVQEALNNLEKHAHAKTVQLRLAVQGPSLVLRIQDDGRGFDPDVVAARKVEKRGIGFTNMRERAAALGGTCEVNAVRHQGTTITVRMPCPDAK
jgi:PAS domain S-box-containing protein